MDVYTDEPPACIALQTEKRNIDLVNLERIATTRWISEDEAGTVRSALLISGQWAAANVTAATELFENRSRAGLVTIVVPKYRPGDWTRMMRAPTDVHIVASEFSSFEWGPNHYSIPGFVVFRTALHAAKWAEAAGVGIVLLGYRRSAMAGAVVLCSAVLAGRVPGVPMEHQRQLLNAILRATGEHGGSLKTLQPARPKRFNNLDEFLEQENERGAVFLIGSLLASDHTVAAIVQVLRQRLNVGVRPDDIADMNGRVPEVSKDGMRAALRKHGWGAFLRRLDAGPDADSAEGRKV
jgi:hypothetical protein